MNINCFYFPMPAVLRAVAIPKQNKYSVNLLRITVQIRELRIPMKVDGNGDEYDNDERVKFNKDNITKRYGRRRK
ncbi:hypothetical protein CEXT_403511 [Caerostris extrusa]|uniref:Uncharacterized protein n=1 Tax=Caerostris extrusa TaxID=172846 RepID=A0AAV4RG71_CAEEX|nr:hypothetical protein CEXT_403511 [Caerostris extrusa]